MLIASLSIFASAAPAAAERRPNIVLIMTDDQGFGDLGVHGNPKIMTPHLDKFAGESVWLKNFYVSPVCARHAGQLAHRAIQLPHRRGRHVSGPGAHVSG